MTSVKSPFLGAIWAFGLAVFVLPSASAAQSLTERLSGKTLTNENATILLGADGRVSGTIRAGELVGAWTERDGQYCRTFTAPERVAGTLCQDVRFNADGTVTFLGGVAGDTTWTMN